MTAFTVGTQLLGSLIIAFVEANEPTSADEDFIFGQIEGAQVGQAQDTVQMAYFEELLRQAQEIRSNSGVGSPEVAKYVDTQAPSLLSIPKAIALRSLAEQLYTRRPVLYLKGHPEPLPATVLLRSARKPSVGALSTALSPGGLFKSPDNSFIVIKFDPQFGYADIIVDPCFTDAFIQQPSTPTYSALLTALPRAFVGTAAELRKMVALLTAESVKAYAEKGASCPPWRRFDAMLARWLPKMFNDDIITHGPRAALAPAAAAVWPTAAAALNPSLFTPAPPAALDFSRETLNRDNSMDSTVSTDSNSTVVSGTSPGTAVASDDYSYSLGSSSSSSSGVSSSSSISSRGERGHSVIYGFEVTKKQQQHEGDAAAVAAAPVAADPVASKLAQAAAGDATAAALDDSIKAVYPEGVARTMSTAVPATTVLAEPLTKQHSLLVHAKTQQLQQQVVSRDSLTTQILAANGYGKPRVIKLTGNNAAAAAPPPTTHAPAADAYSATAVGGKAHQRVCYGTPMVKHSGMLGALGVHWPVKRAAGRGLGFTTDTTYKTVGVAKGSGKWPGGTGDDPKSPLRPDTSKGAEVRGLPTAVADYSTAVLIKHKDTVIRPAMAGGGTVVDAVSNTRIVAGRKVVKLCPSPRTVVRGFAQEGARAA